MKKTKSAGGIVVNKDKILVVAQPNGVWSLPKGHIGSGEDTITTAKREIYEESGIRKLVFIKALGSYQRYKIGLDGSDDQSELKTIHMLLFTTDQKELKPLDPDHPEARWVDRNEVTKLLTSPKDREFFLRVKDALKN